MARERQVFVRQGAQLKTRAYAYATSYQLNSRTLARSTAQQQLITHQLKALDQDLADFLTAELKLARQLAHLTSILGIGFITAVFVVAETSKLALVKNERQLHFICRALCRTAPKWALDPGYAHFAARQCAPAYGPLLAGVSSLLYNPQQMALYARLRARQASGKLGVIAVMRKLLVFYYSLWKNDCAYDPHYHPAHVVEKEVAPTT